MPTIIPFKCSFRAFREHLMMHFGGIKALSDVSLKVERNSI
ncbi:hypothetical protein, partial [Pseudomonas sp. MPR-ANB1]